MVEILLAWVLVTVPFSKESVSVSGIASEKACLALGEKMRPDSWLGAPQTSRYKCFSYEVAK